MEIVASGFLRLLGGAILLSQIPVAAAQQSTNRAPVVSSETFHFKICNSRVFTVYVAVKYNSDGSNYITHGWWPIEPKHCFDISDFRRGDFYVFAQTFDQNPVQVFVIGSDFAKVCIVEKHNFTFFGNRACNASEYRDFSHLVVQRSTLTWNL
jgi:uncharacterized membrane protein